MRSALQGRTGGCSDVYPLGLDVQGQGPAERASGEASLARRGLTVSSPGRGAGSSHHGAPPSRPHDLPPPTTTTVEVRISTHEFWGTHPGHSTGPNSPTPVARHCWSQDAAGQPSPRGGRWAHQLLARGEGGGGGPREPGLAPRQGGESRSPCKRGDRHTSVALGPRQTALSAAQEGLSALSGGA